MLGYTGKRYKVTEQRVAPKVNEQHGIFIRGIYKGSVQQREFTRAGTQEKVTVRPKIGLDVDDEEVVIKAKDDAQLAEVTRGKVRRQLAEFRVEARPPFGSRGSVDFVLPGVIVERGEDWK